MTFSTTEPSVSFSSTTSNTPNRPETTSQEQKSNEKIQPNSGLPARDHLSNMGGCLIWY